MQQDIYKMMRACVRAEKGDIKHIRQPCQWMPIAAGQRGDSPVQPFTRHALFDLRIIRNILIIIKLNVFIATHPKIEKSDKEYKS